MPETLIRDLGVAEQAAEWLADYNDLTTQFSESITDNDGSLETESGAVLVQSLPEVAVIQARFELGLGSLAVGEVVERSNGGKGITGLCDAIEQSANGEAASLEKNIQFALDEALTLEGVMPDVEITRDSNGDLQQDGQGLHGVLANSIQLHPGDHPGLHEIAYAEGLNLYILDELDAAGRLDNGEVWVIPCLVPTNVPAQSIRKYGYFENLAMVWRMVWKEAPGKFKLRSMFMAGVNPEAHEENAYDKMTDEELDRMYAQRLARRHDIAAVSAIYEDLGLPVPDSIPGFLQGILMRRGSFKDPDHPENDFAERFDNKLGSNSFLGRKSDERGDYLADGQRRAEVFKNLGASIKSIAAELVGCRHELADDMAAALRLAQITRRYAVDYVIDHPKLLPIIGPAIGLAAYNSVQEYHRMLAAGDHMGAGRGRAEIHNKSRTNTCGFGDSQSNHGDMAENEGNGTRKNADASGECEFNSKECPLCHKKDIKTRVTRTHIIGSCGCSKRRVPKVYNKKYDHWLS